MTSVVEWAGLSGLKYGFNVYPIGQEFLPVGGIYIMCRFNLGGLLAPLGFQPLYVGETHNLNQRLNIGIDAHDGYKRCLAYGVSHFATRRCDDATERLRIETDLRHGLTPVCNRQGIPTVLNDLF